MEIDLSWQTLSPSELAASNRVRVAKFWESVTARGVVPVPTVAEVTGLAPKAIAEWADQEVLIVSNEGEPAVPEFMLDAELRPRPEFGPICRYLRTFLSPREAWAWLAAPISLLSGDVACEVIYSDPDRVMQAASDYRAQLEE